MLFAGQAPPACFLFLNLPRFLPPSAFARLRIGCFSWGIVFSQLEKYLEAFRETASCGGWNPLLGREEPFRETHEAVWHSFKSISECRNESFSSAQERLFVFGRKSFRVWQKVVLPLAGSPFAFRRKPLLLARKPFFSSKKNRSRTNEMHFMGGIPDFMLNFAR